MIIGDAFPSLSTQCLLLMELFFCILPLSLSLTLTLCCHFFRLFSFSHRRQTDKCIVRLHQHNEQTHAIALNKQQFYTFMLHYLSFSRFFSSPTIIHVFTILFSFSSSNESFCGVFANFEENCFHLFSSTQLRVKS